MSKNEISKAIEKVPASSWEKLSQKRIYFAHQSVGFDIVEGIVDIMKDYPQIALTINESNTPLMSTSSRLEHSRIGTNGDPISKIDTFTEYMKGSVGGRIDIALFKFCYLDVVSTTDIQAVFNHYKSSMASLKRKHPHIQFVHMTVPLKTVQRGLKAAIKKMFGKSIGGYEDNIARNKFNAMLKGEFSDTGLLFDIAGIESLSAGSAPVSFDSNSVSYASLSPEYTYDGGHLNQAGRKVIAGKLLVFLANI